MAAVLPVIQGIGTAIGAATTAMGGPAGLIGTALAAGGTIYQGMATNAAAKSQAASLKARGDEELAAATRRAASARREARLAQSRAAAIAGASGAGVTDPTVTDIMSDLENEGQYNALSALYEGRTKRANYRTEAKIAKQEGRSALMASYLNAGSTIYGNYAKQKELAYYRK